LDKFEFHTLPLVTALIFVGETRLATFTVIPEPDYCEPGFIAI
jgi:hypothetical protein